MLSDRLAELAAEGLVKRSVTDTRPPGVSYSLTDAGAAILPILDQLAGWARRNLAPGCDAAAAAAAAPRPQHAAPRR